MKDPFHPPPCPSLRGGESYVNDIDLILKTFRLSCFRNLRTPETGQNNLGDFLKKMYRRSAGRLKVRQCLADGSPVTDFPSVTPAEALHSYLEIA